MTERHITRLVYVVDDDRSVREAIADLFASVSLSARSFGTVRDFLDADRPDVPSCLVVDVRMPGQSGMDLLARAAVLGVDLPIVIITGHGDIAMAVKAMKDGAIEFLAKPFRDQDLLDAVNRGLERDQERRMESAALRALRRRWDSLNAGEREVMRLVARGLLNKQIALELGVSEITVKVRRGHVMQKMGACNLADLIRAFDRLRPDAPATEGRTRA